MKNFWTIVGVIVSIAVAWWIVSALFSLMWFIAKLGVVLVVAAVVFFVLRGALSGSDTANRS